MIDVFISHSSQDEKLAESLASFIREALSVKPDRIRCTTVSPYRLPGGAHTENQLRAEIAEAKCFLALITPASAVSSWVLIELGARWETNKRLIPLLAKGATEKSIKGPIALVNAHRCDKQAEMEQLIHEMAKEFDDDAPQPSAYRKTLSQLISLARPTSSIPPNSKVNLRAIMEDGAQPPKRII